ncbi:MAG: PRC-barrel domain-containing protein [Candidatus Nanopelagicales bacterium]
MTTSSMRLIRAVEIIGMPVVTIDGGEDVAEVKDVVYDGTNHQLVGFTLNKRGWFRGTLSEVLDAAQIAAIGRDAVMVGSAADVSAPVAAPDAAALRDRGRDVLGNSVITTDGTALGTVSGVLLSAGKRPAAVGYELTDKGGASVLIPISAQLSLSGDNLVVPTDVRSFDPADLAGFGAFASAARHVVADDATPNDQEAAADE